jgi:hypothetical protein
MKRRKYARASFLVAQSMVKFNQSAQLYEKKRWFIAPSFFNLNDHQVLPF